MATCNHCEQEMIGGSSCSVDVLHRDGAAFPLAPVHRREVSRTTRRCGDCGAPAGGFHHLGCDVQTCPHCHHQLLSCGCWFDEDGVHIADDEDAFLDFVAHHWDGALPQAS